MVALVLALVAVLIAATSAAGIRLVLRDGYGPVRTRADYDTRSPSLSRT